MLLLANGHQLRPACSRCSGRRLCVPVRLPSPAFTQLCQLPKRSTRTAATVVTAAPAPDNGPDDRAGSGQNASTSGRDSDAASSTSPGALTGPGTIANASSVAQLSSVADGASSSTPSGEGSRTPAVLIWIQSVFQAIQSFPAWVKAQNLQRLRDASDADAKDADKHAAFLAELNTSSPREVMSRVESRLYASSPAVVAEYIKALANTGKLSEYAQAGGEAQLDREQRTLPQLLKDLQAQASGVGLDDAPGTSQHRPLHVTLHGVPGLGQSATAARGPKGPLGVVWALLRTVAVILLAACLWLIGAQAIKRVQFATSSGMPGTATIVPSPTSSSPSSPSSQGTVNSGGGGPGAGPAVEPKEYKKDEMSEKSIKSFRDVKGCDEAKAELEEVVEFLKHPQTFTRLGAKLPKGVLLTGPPGTGKTLLAKAVAGEAGVPFFFRSGSEFEEMYVGVGSRRMRALFAAAKKKAPCIVFIDEIDAIGGNRKHWENHSRKTLNQLLVEMDGFESNDGVIVMAATNLAESLDPALKRPGRFDRQVAVALPDVKGRKDILDLYLGDKPLAPDVDRDLLSRQTQGFSGADISNLVNEAAIVAAKKGGDHITQGMFEYAFDKILMGVERTSVRRTLEARKHTAYHEAGHALVALRTPGASLIHKATIVPRGHALGMVTQVGRDDEFSTDREQMAAHIMVCMGGTVAEELVFGREHVTSGATSDLQQATSIARHMVSECGLSDAIGPMYVDNHACEGMRQQVDKEVSSMVLGAKQAVYTLLSDNIHELHLLAGALLERETLTREEIASAIAGTLPPAPTTPPTSSSSGSGGPGEIDRVQEPAVAVVAASAQGAKETLAQ